MPTPARRHGRRIPVMLALGMVLSGLTAAVAPTAAASSHCRSSSPAGGAYTVNVCLTQPAAGATVAGAVTTTATVSVTGTSPGVQRAVFHFDGGYLLTDVSSPWTFQLPTANWVDGQHVLQVEALMRDGFLTSRTGINLTFANGVTTPPVNTNTFTPSPGSTPPTGTPFRVAATGDGAGGRNEATGVVNRIAASSPNLLLYLGDVYEKGTQTEFANWYGTATLWGQFRSITNPVIGNHEYTGGLAPGYFDYWDNPPNYYSFDAAGWHFVAINSTSQLSQTAAGSPQYQWLAADLAASRAACTIVYMHHPVVSVGPQGDTTRLNDMWRLMVDSGVDIVLTAHDHSYQRWVALNRDLAADPAGVTQFVVGSGGHGIQSFARTDSRLARGLATTADYGVLLLDLQDTSADYQFVRSNGTVGDSGTVACSIPAVDTTPPSTPANVTATAIDATRVSLSWSASSDDVGVTGYTVRRDGTPIADVPGSATSYLDTTAAPDTAYSYDVEAYDAAGNRSGPSAPAIVTTPPPPVEVAFAPVADSYVDASKPDTNFGSSATLRADASPDLRSYLRFTLTGINGPVTSAQLRLTANANHSTGFRAHGVADNGWTEPGVTYANAPPFDPAPTASSGPLTAGSTATVDVTPLVTGNGTVSLALTTTSSTSLSLGSRESPTPPQLVVQYLGRPNGAPVAEPVTVATVEDQAAAWTPRVSDPEGDPLTCSIATPPPAGIAAVAPDCTTGTYSPAADWNGTETFEYRVHDGTGAATALVTVTVEPANDPPVAAGQSASTPEGAPLAIRLAATDVDGDCPLQFEIVATPAAGTVSVPSNESGAAGVAGADVVFTPAPGFTGTDSFAFRVTDPAGSHSGPGVVAVSVVAAARELRFAPAADGYIDSSKPTTSFGTATTLRADASPDLRSYLRFTVTGSAGPVTRATLRLYANANHSTGFRVQPAIDTGWTEASLTYATAPPFEPNVIAASGSLSAGAWVEVDVTPLVTGDGTVTIAVTTPSKTALSLGSRESANPPELVVVVN